MAVALDVAVIERLGAMIAFIRMPVEARPSIFVTDADEILDQGAADAFAADGAIDEEIFKITVRRLGPGGFMKMVDGEAGDRAVQNGKSH